MRPHPMNLMGSKRNLQWRGPFKPRAKSWKADQTRNRNRNTTANNNEPGRLLRRKMTWISGACQAYQPPRLQDLQFQNSWKASTHFSKRFNRSKTARSSCFQAPGAPLNSTSYLMCVKERGGIACSVTPSPLPVTPALISPLPSPSSSSYRGLADEAKKEWGVNGYGSMSGLIRLRSPDIIIGGGGGLEQGNCKGDDVAHFLSGGDDLAYFMSGSNDMAQCMIEGADIAHFVNEGADVDQCMRGCADVDRCVTGCDDMDQCVSRHDEADGGASERNDVDQCAESVQQLEQKLDHDLSRFVMTYPSNSHQNNGISLMETRMEDQDSHIAHLEEENITLKGHLYVMQQEVGELRRRMLILEHAQFDQTKACSDEKSTADLSCT